MELVHICGLNPKQVLLDAVLAIAIAIAAPFGKLCISSLFLLCALAQLRPECDCQIHLQLFIHQPKKELLWRHLGRSKTTTFWLWDCCFAVFIKQCSMFNAMFKSMFITKENVTVFTVSKIVEASAQVRSVVLATLQFKEGQYSQFLQSLKSETLKVEGLYNCKLGCGQFHMWFLSLTDSLYFPFVCCGQLDHTVPSHTNVSAC